ncbi:hypothetical protein VNO78_16126 [Psophocarpus tetragonolobus]|uniref:Uncharacterized protein n=1 Tax=Psophocarpus tetragonolobus TaxID=3891 RepID=A0AAN9XKE3_PSOTE
MSRTEKEDLVLVLELETDSSIEASRMVPVWPISRYNVRTKHLIEAHGRRVCSPLTMKIVGISDSIVEKAALPGLWGAVEGLSYSALLVFTLTRVTFLVLFLPISAFAND